MATIAELRQYLGDLSAILWNFGAVFPVPTLDPYHDGACGFEFSALLPGGADPRPAVIKMAETWEPSRSGQYALAEYEYDLIEYPLNRRRAYHRHSERDFLREHGVAVHEHCEEVLGAPACGHSMGLPVDGYEAIRRLTSLWGQHGSLGCSALRCMG